VAPKSYGSKESPLHCATQHNEFQSTPVEEFFPNTKLAQQQSPKPFVFQGFMENVWRQKNQKNNEVLLIEKPLHLGL